MSAGFCPSETSFQVVLTRAMFFSNSANARHDYLRSLLRGGAEVTADNGLDDLRTQVRVLRIESMRGDRTAGAETLHGRELDLSSNAGGDRLQRFPNQLLEHRRIDRDARVDH